MTFFNINSKQQPEQIPMQKRAETPTEKRRCKIVYVPHGFIMSFLTFSDRECIIRPIIKNLPDSGCEIRTVRYFPERDSFGFIVYHPSFDIVPMGIMCPEIIVEEIVFQRIENYKIHRPTIPDEPIPPPTTDEYESDVLKEDTMTFRDVQQLLIHDIQAGGPIRQAIKNM